MSAWISRDEVLQLLGLKPQTLYAYVSRRLIAAHPDAGDPRRSLYSRADAERLRQQRMRGRRATEIAESAISWGEAVLPTAILAKAHMPDLAQVVPAFNVESIEGHEAVTQRFSRKVEFESIDFNKRFWATVPSEHDPVALRELFGPGFLEWVTTMTGEIDFGVNDRQLWFLWRLRERSEPELKAALKNAGELFRRLQSEMDESGINTYPPGPWHAGLEPFPAS